MEDVLVKVNELIFLADFYIIYMGDPSIPCLTPVLLGRPFMKTARTKIGVHAGSLTMEFDGELIKLNIFEDLKNPNDLHSVCLVAKIDSVLEGIGDVNSDYQDQSRWHNYLDYCWEHYHIPFMEWVMKKIFKIGGQSPGSNLEFVVEGVKIHMTYPD